MFVWTCIRVCHYTCLQTSPPHAHEGEGAPRAGRWRVWTSSRPALPQARGEEGGRRGDTASHPRGQELVYNMFGYDKVPCNVHCTLWFTDMYCMCVYVVGTVWSSVMMCALREEWLPTLWLPAILWCCRMLLMDRVKSRQFYFAIGSVDMYIYTIFATCMSRFPTAPLIYRAWKFSMHAFPPGPLNSSPSNPL